MLEVTVKVRGIMWFRMAPVTVSRCHERRRKLLLCAELSVSESTWMICLSQQAR